MFPATAATAKWQARAALSRPERVHFQPPEEIQAQISIATSFQTFPNIFFFENKRDLLRWHERNRGSRFLRNPLFRWNGDDDRAASVAQLRTKC